MSLLVQYSLPLLLFVAAISDMKSHRIPNWIPVALLIGFVAFAGIGELTLLDLASHMGVGLAVLICGFILFAFNILGGGDAKLLAAGAVWMGPMAVIPFVAYTALAGGLFSLAILIFRQAPLPATAVKVEWISRLHLAGEGIPYGVAIAIGGLSALLLSTAHPYTIY